MICILTFPYRNLILGNSNDIKLHPLSDSSGFYSIGANSNRKAFIWKHLLSNLSSSECQLVSSDNDAVYNQFMISDQEFLLFLSDYASPFTLHFHKITFSNLISDWSNMMAWPTSAWIVYNSESNFNSDSSEIYTFFIYMEIQEFFILQPFQLQMEV